MCSLIGPGVWFWEQRFQYPPNILTNRQNENQLALPLHRHLIMLMNCSLNLKIHFCGLLTCAKMAVITAEQNKDLVFFFSIIVPVDCDHFVSADNKLLCFCLQPFDDAGY